MTAEVTTKRQASRFSEIFEDLLTFAPSGSSFVASIQAGDSLQVSQQLRSFCGHTRCFKNIDMWTSNMLVLKYLVVGITPSDRMNAFWMRTKHEHEAKCRRCG